MREPEKPRPRTLKTILAARLISWIARTLCSTLRLTIERCEETEQLMEHGGVLVTWHGRTLVPIIRFRGRSRYFMLVSLSRDGDLQTEVIQCLGCTVVRGSTGRRGVAATREVLAKLTAGGVLAFTPDGPRGPAGVVQPGAVYFAQRAGVPIVPAGITVYPRWEASTWDRYQIPKPFARAVWIYGDPIYVAPEDDLDNACLVVQRAIDELQTRAEAAVLVA